MLRVPTEATYMKRKLEHSSLREKYSSFQENSQTLDIGAFVRYGASYLATKNSDFLPFYEEVVNKLLIRGSPYYSCLDPMFFSLQ